MNGRIYDPLTAQFFSPDPYLQAPDNWLNYNRYSYCINNPFKYTDKSGYWFGLDDLIVAGAAFVAGYVTYGIATGNWGWKALGAGASTALGAWLVWNTGPMALAAVSSAYSTVGGGILATYGLLCTDEGYDLQKLVSPVALHLNLGIGSDQEMIGWEVSVGVPEVLPGYRKNYGESYYWNSYDNAYNGKVTIEGGEWSFGLAKLQRNTFTSTDSKGNSTSQSTNRVSFGLPGVNVRFEDNQIDLCDNLPGIAAPHSDDLRSSALELNFLGFNAGFKIMDGVDSKIDPDPSEDGYKYKIETNVHRFGLAYFGFGPLKLGYKSEKNIRAGIQNGWHKMIGAPLWDVLSITDMFFWNFGSTGGSTLW